MNKKLAIVSVVTVLLSAVLAGLMGYSNSLGLLASAVLLVVVPCVIAFWIYPLFGFLATLVVSFFLLGILRFVEAPLGTILDGLIALLFFSFLWAVVTKKFAMVTKHPLVIWVIVWIVYNILEVVNPFAASREAWIYTIRSVALALLLFFVAARAISDYNALKYFVLTWVFLAALLAFYGLVQEFNGLLPFEEQWVRAKEERFLLIYNWGRFRKFSFFADPTTYGIVCAYTGVFCLVMAIGVKVKLYKRLILAFLGFIMVFAMVFSGTRTAYVMPVAGLMFYVCLNFNWKIFSVFAVLATVFVGIIVSPIKSLGPLDANNLERIRSAFMPSDDPSFQVRLKNQAFIQPFIQKNPLGGGLGSTGVWGKRFSPWSPLSQFPPDSGFVKIGVEQGTVGLVLYCLLLYYVFNEGINNYFKEDEIRKKNIIGAILCTLFSILVANYAQETITMFPTSVIVYGMIGALFAMNKSNIRKNNLLI
jgi:putative inorganic carbon (hco3(-)) transporter